MTPDDDREGHVYHQRDRACGGQPAGCGRPGCTFDETIDKSTDKTLHSVSRILSRGAWLGSFDVDKATTRSTANAGNRSPCCSRRWAGPASRLSSGSPSEIMRSIGEGQHRRHRRGAVGHPRKLRPGEPRPKSHADVVGKLVLQGAALRLLLARVGRYRSTRSSGCMSASLITSSTPPKKTPWPPSNIGPLASRAGTTMTGRRRGAGGNRRHRPLRQPPPAHGRRADPNQIRVGINRMERVVRGADDHSRTWRRSHRRR